MIAESRLLEDESLVAEMRKRRNSSWTVCKTYVFIGIFITFVALYQIMVLAEPQERHRDFRNTLRQTFDTEAQFPLKDVNSIPALWNYFNHTLFPAIMVAEVVGDSSLTLDRVLTATSLESARLDLFGTQLIGSRVLIRTFRVTKNSNCMVDHTFVSELETKTYDCYPAYSEATKSEADFGRGRKVFQYGRPESLSSMNVTSINGAFPELRGKISNYIGNGFLMTFGAGTLAESSAQLDFALEKQFVDLATRAVAVEFNAWNPNEGFIGVVRILFERSLAGKWENSFTLDVISERYLTLTFDAVMVVELLVCLLVCVYIGEEMSELCIRKSDYLNDGWNVVDWANLIMLLIFMGLRGTCFVYGNGVMETLMGDTYIDLSFFAYYVDAARNINAFNTIFVALKIIKIVTFIPYVQTLIWTLRNSWKFFVSYAVIYLSVFVGFSLAYNVGFGEKFQELSSFRGASLFLARSFLGDVDLTAVYESSRGLGGLLISLFIAVMYFLCMNLFFGIMISALAEAKLKLALTSDATFEKWKRSVAKQLSTMEHIMFTEFGMDRYFPRWAARRRKTADRKYAIQEEKMQQEAEATLSLSVNDGGPSSLHCGRTKKKRNKAAKGEIVLATVSDSSSDSEVDLGPLSKSAINRRKRLELLGQVQRVSEPELYFTTIQHLATGLQERGESIQEIITSEMKELTHLCAGVHVVLEVLVRRSNEMHEQQTSFLRGC